MTAPTPEEMARTHAGDAATPDADALSRFLQGPVKGAAPVEALAPMKPSSSAMPPSDDPANVQRRRWGTSAAIEASPGPSTAASQQQSQPTGGASWWQKTSWFAGANADVSPVLADPTGANGGTPSHGGIVAGSVQNRFTGPGQREPHAPVTSQSVRLWENAAPVEDPGECYGGHNGASGAPFRAVGGAMAHSRLSLQPKRVRGPTCADDFEKESTEGGAHASTGGGAHALRDKGRYEYDWSRKVWAVKGGGDVVNVPTPNEGSFEHDSVDSMELESESEDTCTEEEVIEPVSEETMRLMETTRGLRLDRFSDAHDAAVQKAAEKKRALAAAKTAEKRSAYAVPLAQRDGTMSGYAPTRHTDGSSTYEFHHETVRDDEEQWRMLRLRTGETVYFGAPDTLPETVAAWLDGTKPWPEIRTMELSIAARRAASVPPGAPGPVVPDDLAAAAKAELRIVAEEDAAAAELLEAQATDASKDGGAPGVKMAPGSTATPQQANIIEQLVNATGASKQALEEAAEKAKEPLSSAATDKQTEALKDRLREVIREKHDIAVRAREAEERVVALEGALRAAGVAVP